jgi:Ca2+-dependent lipid-binding protein
MDLMGTCDAFCDIAWNGQERKTKIVKNSYSPDWDETFTFVFEDVAAVGDLTLLVLDFDRLTDPDQVGKVVCARLRRVLQLQASAQVKAGKHASQHLVPWRHASQGILPLLPPSTLDAPTRSCVGSPRG